MSYRAAIILIQAGKIALIERHKQGQHYFVFPGGHIEPGETPKQADARETLEELGLQVEIRKLAAEIWWNGNPQYYYLVEGTGGTFGSGTGEEMQGQKPEKGTYQPVWVPLQDLPNLPLMPPTAARLLLEAQAKGWPEPAPILHDEE